MLFGPKPYELDRSNATQIILDYSKIIHKKSKSDYYLQKLEKVKILSN